MSVGHGNRLKIQTQAVNGLNDSLGLVAGIDADRLPGGFTTDDAGVLLESGDG